MKDISYSTMVRADKVSLWNRLNSSSLLSSLVMELTERCNNDCVHCYINQPVNNSTIRARELSTNEIKDILREAASLGSLRVRFTGGEPLLREDFEELYLFARRLGLRVLLFTNATLITPYLAELLARVPPLEVIEVSFYGMKRRSYEGVTRVPGSFEAAWRGINLLLEKQIPFLVKSALLPSNKEEMHDFETWTATIPWMDKPPSYSMFFDLRCRRDSEERNKLIRGLRVSPEEGLKVLTRKHEGYLRGMKEFCSKFLSPPSDKLFSCGAGKVGVCVDAYGNFQPCIMLRHSDTVYDLKRGSLKDALTHFFPEVRKMRADNPDYLARCSFCFLKGLCEQCPAKSCMEYGTLDTPVEYLCEVAHAQARYLGLIEEGELAWEIKDWKGRIRNFSGKEPTCQERR
jgi:radical SAM protein with 4Fe4S-binding SPASM domain